MELSKKEAEEKSNQTCVNEEALQIEYCLKSKLSSADTSGNLNAHACWLLMHGDYSEIVSKIILVCRKAGIQFTCTFYKTYSSS